MEACSRSSLSELIRNNVFSNNGIDTQRVYDFLSANLLDKNNNNRYDSDFFLLAISPLVNGSIIDKDKFSDGINYVTLICKDDAEMIELLSEYEKAVLNNSSNQ